MSRALVVVTALSLALHAGCSTTGRPEVSDDLPSRWLSSGLSVGEAQEVLSAALELAVVQGRLEGYSARPARIPVLVTGVESLLLPAFSDVEFFKATAEDLQQLADRSGRYIFYLNIRGAWRDGDAVAVAVDKLVKYPHGTTSASAQGSGITARFKKTDRGWEGQVQRMWTE